MIQEIKTVEDIKTFFNELLTEDLSFHPDDDFFGYINCETEQPSYTKEEAEFRNSLLNQSFNICEAVGEDIYELCIEIFMKDFYAAYPQED